MDRKEIYISGSLSCIDLLNIEREMKEVEASDVSFLHYDVVDGEFNDCFIFGDLILEKLRPLTTKKICVHLAVNEPLKYIAPFAKRGADCFAVHLEAKDDLHEVFQKIREYEKEPVLAVRVDSTVDESFLDIAKDASWILKHTVMPGYSGQPMRQEAVGEIRKMRKMLDEAGLEHILIEADGNINETTIPIVVRAGANILTGGSSGLFRKGEDINENFRKMRKLGLDALKERE